MAIRSYLKGFAGEFLNRVGHRLLLPRKAYHAFHNVVIPTRNGTTEVDHLLVSRFGIFVIETKHWSGWLFGTEREKTWTRVHFRDKRQVANPLRQNYGHVRDPTPSVRGGSRRSARSAAMACPAGSGSSFCRSCSM